MKARHVAVLLAALACSLPAVGHGYAYLAANQCPNGASWPSGELPLDYYINREGSDDIAPFSRLEQAIQDSFRAWQSPCCSSFSATYGGTTGYTALDSPSERGRSVVLSWRESNWPAQLGHPYKTVAISQPRIENCEIIDGTILYNGAYQEFTTTSGTDKRRVRVVTTHEVGHLVGLAHSADSDATMAPRYHSGMESLESDDRTGVCSLYDNVSCSCSSDAECTGGRTCQNGSCSKPSCDAASDCPEGTVCEYVSGDCVRPTCSRDADCEDGYQCNSEGTCVPECTVCRTCTSRADCGARGICAEINGSNKCVTQCGPSTPCPGDSECFAVQTSSGSAYYLCLNPGADSGDSSDVCPSSYTCTVGDPVESRGDAGGDAGIAEDVAGDSCPSLGTTCSRENQSRCGADAEGCMLLADGSRICTCSCESERDCGAGNSCISVGTDSWCYPNDSPMQSTCSDVSCAEGAVCRSGTCVQRDAGSDVDANADEGAAVVEVAEQTGSDGCAHASDDSPLPLAGLLLALLGGALVRRRAQP